MEKQEKENIYRDLLVRTHALLGDETRAIPAMANICALLKEAFGFFWVGFYIADGDELVLGPFQGPVACMTIRKGKGVCGACRERGEIIVVPDVEAFPGHIACNPHFRSEIVVPVKYEGDVVAVLDIDSERLGDLDDTDADFLPQLLDLPFIPGIDKIYNQNRS